MLPFSLRIMFNIHCGNLMSNTTAVTSVTTMRVVVGGGDATVL